MPRRVPVLRHDHSGKIAHFAVDPRDNFVSAIHCERSAWAKIILDVDDE
jgi:hypothetical protein